MRPKRDPAQKLRKSDPETHLRPRGLSARRLIEVYASMIGIETQTVLVHGTVDNATPDALDALGEALRFIHPRSAHVGTIDRKSVV